MAAAKPNSQTTDTPAAEPKAAPVAKHAKPTETAAAEAKVAAPAETAVEAPAEEAPAPADEPKPAAEEKAAETADAGTFGTWAVAYAEGALALVQNLREELDALSETHKVMFTHVPANPASTMHVRRLYSALLDLSIDVQAVQGIAGSLASHSVENEPQS